MIDVSSICVNIKYKMQDGTSKTLSVDPFVFFDTENQSNEESSLFDLGWKHGHACQYIDLEPAALVLTELEVQCPSTREFVRDIEQFWAQGGCRTLLRQEGRGNGNLLWYRFLEIKTGDGIHFVRFSSASDEEPRLIEHGLIRPDESVVMFYPIEIDVNEIWS